MQQVETYQKVFSSIKDSLPQWSQLTLEDVDFSSSVGLTNIVYIIKVKLTKKGQTLPNSLIYREFKENSLFIITENERKYFMELGNSGFGPKCYALTDKFRLEEFIEGQHPESKEMLDKKFNRRFSKCIAEIHNFNVSVSDKTPIVLKILNEDNCFIKFINESLDTTPHEKKFEFKTKTLIKEFFGNKEEISFLREKLPQNSEAICFCHNDLNKTNFFYFEKDEKISFSIIDCDYSGYNYRGFDLASYIVEIPYNYSYFPKIEYFEERELDIPALKDISKYYIFFNFAQKYKIIYDENLIIDDDKKIDEILEKSDLINLFNQKLEEFFEELKIGLLLCYFYYGIWILCKGVETIEEEYDRIGLVELKIRIYKNRKRQFFNI